MFWGAYDKIDRKLRQLHKFMRVEKSVWKSLRLLVLFCCFLIGIIQVFNDLCLKYNNHLIQILACNLYLLQMDHQKNSKQSHIFPLMTPWKYSFFQRLLPTLNPLFKSPFLSLSLTLSNFNLNFNVTL